MPVTGSRVRELAQLLRLRGLRTAAAARECAQCRSALETAQTAVKLRIERIAQCHRERESFEAQLVGPHARDVARFASTSAARRDQLNEQIEREEYALLDDEEALKDAQAQLADALARWSRERAREDGVRELLRAGVQEAVQIAEAQIEAEAQDRRSPPPLGAMR
jgi:superfamily II RNA helicase